MNPRITLAVVALFLVALGYVYFVEAPKTEDQLSGRTPRPAPQVFQLGSGQVQTLELRNLRTGQQFRMSRSGDTGWQVEKPESRAADTFRVEPIIEGFAQLQASRVFTDVTDLTQYGVLTGTLEARVIMRDSTPWAITVGNKTTDGTGYYAIFTGAKTPLFIIGPSLIEEWLKWFDAPPFEPTPTPTLTATPPVSATPAVSPTPVPSSTPTLLAAPSPSAIPTR